jgi:hypothetical protein
MAFSRRIADALLGRAGYLSLRCRRNSGIPIRRFIRPRGRWTTDGLADIVEDRAGS